MQDLKVSTIQADLHWEDKQENLKMFEMLIKNIQESTDLILLPEMFSTGFSMRAAELAEEMDGNTSNNEEEEFIFALKDEMP